MKEKKKIIIFSSQLSNINFFLLDLILSFNTSYKFFLVTRNDVKPINYTNITYINFNFNRKISIFNDLKNIYQLYKITKKINPNLILSITPKVGFLITLINLLSNFNRIHFYTGQIWYNKKGLLKFFFKYLDKLSLINSKLCFVDSKSQLNYLIKEGFNKKKLKLINHGSICGVDTSLYKKNLSYKINFFNKYNLKTDTIVILFMGRITKDKGFWELINLYEKLKNINLQFKLVLVGNDEELLLMNLKNYRKNIFSDLIILKHTNEPQKILCCADVFILLSKREGFGLSVIQASSCELPVIGKNIVGLQDSIIDNQTGILIDDIEDIKDFKKILLLLKDYKKRLLYGKNGRIYVQNKFEKNDVLKFLKKEILGYLN